LEVRKDAVTAGYRQLSQKYKDIEAKVEAWQHEKAEIEKCGQDTLIA
jgi:hypothetical protein